MSRWTKRPVTINAWVLGTDDLPPEAPVAFNTQADLFSVRTLEGDMAAYRGDYLIQGVKGEFYACRADIFHETYVPAAQSVPEVYSPIVSRVLP